MTKTKKALLISVVVLFSLVAFAGWYFLDVYTDCRMSDETFNEVINYRPEDYFDSVILYADEQKTVFHFLSGIFTYNYNEDKIERIIDIKKLNCAINEQKQNMGTTILSDGEKIALINYGDEKEKFDNYLVYIKSGLAKKEMEPEMMQGGAAAFPSWISELDCWRSGMCTYVGNEMFYIELDKGDKIAKIKLVAADNDSDERREFYPFD